MDKELQKKLEILRQTFAKNIPAKLEEIEGIAHRLQEKYTREDLVLLHRKAHSLKGTAATFQYQALSEAAEKLEILAESMLEQNAKFDPIQTNNFISGLKQAWPQTSS